MLVRTPACQLDYCEVMGSNPVGNWAFSSSFLSEFSTQSEVSLIKSHYELHLYFWFELVKK